MSVPHRVVRLEVRDQLHVLSGKQLVGIAGAQMLGVNKLSMVLRSALERVHLLVAHALIEAWCLETVRGQDDLHTAATTGFSFGRSNKRLSEPLAAMQLMNPNMRKLAATAPRMTAKACDDCALLVSHSAGQALSIEVPGRAGIELVNAIDQE